MPNSRWLTFGLCPEKRRPTLEAPMKKLSLLVALSIACSVTGRAELGANERTLLSPNIRTVLDHTRILEKTRDSRLPLWILPISGQLSSLKDSLASETLRELQSRGIGYTVNWNPDRFEDSLSEGLRIGRMQQSEGQLVGVNANACLYSFFDGSDETLHVDEHGVRFSDDSFGPKLGCPFALTHRYPAMKERVARFLREYARAGVEVDFIFADWEIDGPIEWNSAWEHSKRCSRCREQVGDMEDFRAFQRALRKVRSEMQRVVFGDMVRSFFPDALVGNYGVYPHEGHRYWYDYFEKETEGAPYRLDQKAKYREWYPEFSETGYSFAMPVIYTWYRGYDWYDFESSDYRWFYNMLLVGSNAAKSTPETVPLIPFVHWHTTAPPENPSPQVQQFSKEKYRELLWHLLLRGHDTFFLWCLGNELAVEVEMLHEVYRDSLNYSEFLTNGEPVSFDVPESAGTVISGLRVGDRVLVRRTDFGSPALPSMLQINSQEQVLVPANSGLHVLRVQSEPIRDGYLEYEGERRFALGCYELPSSDEALGEMVRAGINLFRCGSRADLDRVHRLGAMGWVPLGVQGGATDELEKKVSEVAGHPALTVWEGPDEIIWTYTAYSFLKEVAGFTREDWNAQVPKAVNYSRKQSKIINPAIHHGIQMVRDLDPHDRPFWINEAADSDVFYARETIDSVDVVGCDYYAIRATGSDLPSVGRLVKRWDAIGYGRPVWMVLQGFSWHSIKPERARLYPSFEESRFMAYDSIVHGARGVFYWGTNTIDDPRFRTSLYAVTRELSALEPFLVAPAIDSVRSRVIDDLFDPPGIGVRVMAKHMGSDLLVVLVNEDEHRHLGVDISGLGTFEGRTLHLLYGDERQTIRREGFATRMQGFEVKVFCTNPIFQTAHLVGRQFRDKVEE